MRVPAAESVDAMIKAVAFDLDYTLYDRHKTYEKMVDGFMNFFREELRRDVDREEVLKALEDSDRKGIYEAAHFTGIYARLLETGIFLREPGFEKYYYEYIETAYPPAVTEYEDTMSTLRALRERGYKLGILTNGPSKYQRDKLDSTNIMSCMDALIVGGDLPQQKPARIAFESIVQALECEPQEVAYVGDHPRVDMDGARRWGLTPIWMRSVGTWLEGVEPVEKSIGRLSELLELLPPL